MSAPKGFNRAKREAFLTHLRFGMRRGVAADQEDVQIDRFKLRAFIAEDDAFRARVEDAEVDALELIEEALFQAAQSGNVTAAKHWIALKGPQVAPVAAAGAQEPQAIQSADAPDDEDPFAALDNVEAIRPRRLR